MLPDDICSVAENDKEDKKYIGSDNGYICHGA